MPMAVACMQACEWIGLPESEYMLSQTVAYLALAPKSNAATVAIGAARKDVAEQKIVPVPKHLRDSHSASAEREGRGEGYVYSHDSPDAIAAQDYLGVDRSYYEPVDRGFERELRKRKEWISKRLKP